MRSLCNTLELALRTLLCKQFCWSVRSTSSAQGLRHGIVRKTFKGRARKVFCRFKGSATDGVVEIRYASLWGRGGGQEGCLRALVG